MRRSLFFHSLASFESPSYLLLLSPFTQNASLPFFHWISQVAPLFIHCFTGFPKLLLFLFIAPLSILLKMRRAPPFHLLSQVAPLFIRRSSLHFAQNASRSPFFPIAFLSCSSF
jgi:hypothetical protein